MYFVDLNSDLGEGAAFDSQIIPLITSANIACGFHAGDSDIMNGTVKLCKANSVSFGAHPGYPDKENFGRTAMNLTPDEVYNITLYQLGALSAFAKANGVRLRHIKPHGAMYNSAAKDLDLALAIANAVKDFDETLILLALSGSKMIEAAKSVGIKYASEVFADRAYEADGSLRKRTLDGSMITDENEAIFRVIRMIKEGKVTAYTGEDVPIEAHSVCVHGDGEKALDFVRALNIAFAENDIKTVPLSEVID
ncbi:MAG: 5-oxoprolinase subunit PxpA [Clostridia bacterium]|nr:5-oxoprolinase subunit PxpA [Clostridia bacterium]MDO4364497.1 5-oxoprolinase subunit PxpA [Clostridia bacterium]